MKYCINYRKDPRIWGSQGCFGYPALVLLLSIADTIGSFVIGDSVKKHFDILNDNTYYGLALRKKDIDIIYKKYRCFSTHNSVLGLDCYLDISNNSGVVFEYKNNKPYLYLEPFYQVTQKALKVFLNNANSVVYGSKQLKEILKS